MSLTLFEMSATTRAIGSIPELNWNIHIDRKMLDSPNGLTDPTKKQISIRNYFILFYFFFFKKRARTIMFHRMLLMSLDLADMVFSTPELAAI